MSKNDSERPPEPAQPMLRGINIAHFLCDGCLFEHTITCIDRRTGNGLGLPPIDATDGESEDLDHAERWWYDLPGRL